MVVVAAMTRSPHLKRITSGRGRPRLDSTAWVACALQILRDRWLAVVAIGFLALLPAWYLGERLPIGEPWMPVVRFGVPWVASLLGESALLGVASQALAERPSRPLKMIAHALWRLPVMLLAIALRSAAVVGILALGALAADRAGEFASLVLVTAVMVAISASSALSLASAVAFCERCGPIHALAVSASLTRNLRMTVLKAQIKLVILLLIVGAAIGEIPWPTLREGAERLHEVVWFASGALLTSVSYLVLRARGHRQRVEVAAREIAEAIA